MNVGSTGLTTVLKVKEFQERSAQRELAAIKVNRANEEQTLDKLEESRTNAMDDEGDVTRIKAADLQTSHAFIDSLGRQISQQEDRVDAIKQQEDQKRDELVEKSKSRQIVEKLDARKQEEAGKESERKSQRVMDVLAQRMKMGF